MNPIDFIISVVESVINFLFATFVFTKTKPVKLMDTSYSLKPLVGPVLKGNLLRVLACILKIPILGGLIIKQLAKDNKFDDIIDFAAAVGTKYEPMPVPPRVCPPDALNLSDIKDNEMFLKKLYSHYQALQQQRQKKNIIDVDEEDDNDDEVSKNEDSKSLIRELHGLFLRHQITPLDYVKHCLRSIRESHTSLRAFILLEEEEKVLRAAQESTDRYARGQPVSMLDGIPVGVKCCIPVKGFTNTIGSSLFATSDDPADRPIDADTDEAATVRRLRAAKAVIVGLNNMHELGIGGSGANNFFGAARNPHDTSRQSGGSSSGGAVALAAGLVPVVVSSDGGGSGRGPFGYTGVVGFKPGYQVVPTKAGLAYSVYHEGPACCTVEDCRIVFEILAQQSLIVPSLRFSSSSSSSSASRSSRKNKNNNNSITLPPRIGIFRDHAEDSSIVMRQTYTAAEARLRSLGCEIVDVAIPNLFHASIGLNISILIDIFGALQGKRHLIGKKVDPAHQIMLLLASSLSGAHVLASQIARRWFVEVAMPKIFNDCDVILSPSTGTVAPPAVAEPFGEVDLSQTSNFVRFLFFANFVGCPAITVPTGMSAKESRDSLPVAVHLMGDYGKEDVLLQVAKMVEHSDPKMLRPRPPHNYFPDYL